MSMTIAHSQRLLQLKHLAQALCWGSWAFCGMAHAVCDPGQALTKYDELKSLPDRSGDHPAINTRWFPATLGDGVWSSTPYSAEHTRTVRVVYFYSGHSDDNDKRAQLLVRWVRAGD